MHVTTIIGLEVHVQLLTASKLFCGCANRFNPDQPNVQTCPVCLGLPGSLPVLNREAFRLALRTGLALNCEIPEFTKWDRKQYYYPDLPKGYQISQFDLPLSVDGWLEIATDEPDANAPSAVAVAPNGEPRRIRIIRAHLEEDAGKNLHDESGRGGDSRVDLNRAGTPLLEIVSQPDLRSAAEARRYLEELKLLLTYLGVSDCNMQEGSLRCDANVNLHVVTDDGRTLATPIVEIKNLNTFRGVEQAIEFECGRQLDEWQRTGRQFGDPGVEKETRGWDADRGVTFAQRGKEEASDYRYFPDPDLVPVTVGPELLEEIRAEIGESPAERRTRLGTIWQLSDYDVGVIIDQGRAFADYFEQVAQSCGDGKQAANWVTQDVLRELNERAISIEAFPVPAEALGAVVRRIAAGDITVKSGREVFRELLQTVTDKLELRDKAEAYVVQAVKSKGLSIIADTGGLQAAVLRAIGNNPKAADDFKSGKQAAIGKLIGEVMREFRGADAKIVRQMIIEQLSK
ncbi:MAG TPA: Asp-tRNA(Asn)/Glu-tRNA(Gln) amidotransferase subunit GatB [Planctomycetaceae bacterium]|nr:Asp-tRNA(Asn)/Glu-tRNA(Gln) amidotransferase subunit GatB [Planctomycetaceae bacterium]